ncbi:MAG: class I SAM-dependent methyltransferase [Hymenobacter sp.]
MTCAAAPPSSPYLSTIVFDGQRLQGHSLHAAATWRFWTRSPRPRSWKSCTARTYFTDRPNYDRTEEGQNVHRRRQDAGPLSQVRPDKFTTYMQRHYPGRRFRYLEVGCGPGYTLKSLQSLGWETHGLEISEHAADYARRELHLPVVTGNIETTEDFNENQFDLAYLGDVLEHLLSPAAAIWPSLAASWSPGGLLVLALPSVTESAQRCAWASPLTACWVASAQHGYSALPPLLNSRRPPSRKMLVKNRLLPSWIC